MVSCSGLFSLPTKSDILFFISYILVFYILCLGYNYTLQGGDVTFILDRAVLFAAIMLLVCVTSVLLTTLAIARFPSVLLLTKLITLPLSWWILLNNATNDLNTTLESHGQYNFLMFCLLCFLGMFLFILIEGCIFLRKRSSPCQFYGSLIVLFFLFAILWQELSRQERVKWNKGLSGTELHYNYTGCSVSLPGTPWVGVIPKKTFNFYLPSSCPKVKKFSSFSNGVLSVRCPDKNATIIEHPDFLDAHTDSFIIEENGWKNWKNITKAQEKKYEVQGNTELNISAEYFQVFCGDLENFYVQHVPKPDVLDRLKQVKNKEKMNLLVFQIDTLSRAHFMRRMEKTVKTLEKLNKTKDFQVFQMMRLSTIGFNTEVNTKALYTGSQYRAERGGRPLWDIFRKQGNAVLYLNGFCEDWSSRFLKRKASGMDYFTFQPWCHPEYTPVNKTFSNFDGVNSMRRRCINGEKVHLRVFRYLKEFWNSHKDFGKMVLAPMQESHEVSMDVISTLDPDMADLLNYFYKSGELNKTIILITSDHGSHMSLYYILSHIGKLEHRLPGMFFIFPNWFLEKYQNFTRNLKMNEQPLVSHYDTHWALKSLTTLPEFGGSPEEAENNQYIAVWDCRKNEKYIKDIWFFRDKKFYNVDALENFDSLLARVLKKIETCVVQYSDESPQTPPILEKLRGKNVTFENIPPCESDKCYSELNVYEVIKDKESYYWLLDALTEMQQSKVSKTDVVEEYSSDLKVFQTFQGNKIGRYVFGSSLFHYSYNKTCLDIGGGEWCACD